ncbi:hypothetical protein BS50DRAFT_18111 [Corynespora cassiicola Philippines]|uniref:Uncharacterized protein n=1 Tax=Corynespora cassiicola Philippines TaxID=1448308 RepID=A0A2T2PA53_CORCC|nr:hypothetical protein BS50DRAFT_18111 [Corynespora cassiicola Philippines]
MQFSFQFWRRAPVGTQTPTTSPTVSAGNNATLPTEQIANSIFPARASTPVDSHTTTHVAPSYPRQSEDVKMEDAPPFLAQTQKAPFDWESFIRYNTETVTLREKLIPKGQQEKHTKTPAERDIASEIEIEMGDDLGPDYLCTWKGQRFCDPNQAAKPTCKDGLHQLMCGHWIKDSSGPGVHLPCGSNCENPSVTVAPFRCYTCRDDIYRVLTTKPTKQEAARLSAIDKSPFGENLLLGFIMELLAKHWTIKPGMAETITWMLAGERLGYGRECETANACDRVTSAMIGVVSDWIYLKNKSQAEKDLRQQAEEQKHLQCLGKRKGTSDNELSFASPPTSTIGSPFVKKHKTQLETHREPITDMTRGTKRSSPVAKTFDELFHPKRICTTSDIKFGQATFATAAPGIVGPVIRKRESEDTLIESAIESERKKRFCIPELRDTTVKRQSMWPWYS